jgi:hypothetical protein
MYLPNASGTAVRTSESGETMSRFQMDDGKVVDTKNAQASWNEDTRWNGNNHISVNTGSQWASQTLYRSRKGRYYVVHYSAYQGTTPHAEWISDEEAARWLLANNEELPEDLEVYAENITE